MKSPYSTKSYDFTIEEGCPWYEAQQSYGAPNVNWCEPTQCAIINEPANTWSNLPYLIIGLVLIKKMKDKPINAFPYIIIIMGLFSGIYHASNNYLTQLLDFVGMFLMMCFYLSFNFNRVFTQFKFHFYSVYWFLVFANTLMFLTFDILKLPAQQIMLINTLPIIVLDLVAGYKEGSLKQYKYFAAGLVFLGVAQAFAIIDIKRIYCEPTNTWLHGHVIWHCLGSIAMLFIGLHLKTIFKNNSK